MMNNLVNVETILSLHDQSIQNWKEEGVQISEQGFNKIVQENHAFNYQLWHAEDRARRNDMGFEFVYTAKRQIDGFNQQRNDCMEKMDQFMVEQFQPALVSECPVHSETPGMIIDRLSILSLKIYHMRLQAYRDSATELHRQNCKEKLNRLIHQRHHLAECLKNFIEQIINKERTFFIYQQFKMYNDKDLNPELYQH